MLLEVDGLRVGYGHVSVVEDLNLRVERGQVVALLGPNGAGKTTTLLGLSGALPIQGGEVRLDGAALTSPLHRRAKKGLGLITEGRGIFKQLTARENLRVGRVDTAAVLDLFPQLEKRLDVKAGLLSGGEQQMLAVGRAMARNAELLLIDELSLGLAPLVVDRLLQVLRSMADRGVGILLVEQHVRKILEIADYVYVLQRGRVSVQGTAADLRDRLEEIEASYFAAEAGASPAAQESGLR
jgi:ABC-type branched-subunit amino acid transport system ATPase component